MSPTITTPAMTQAGIILGTAAYMSPEQARGKTVDKRADVWAFGCVLYEMLTGRRAFDGDDVSDTLAAVLRAEPDWSALPFDTPPAIRRLLRRSLDKNLRSRLSDMAMVRVELSDAEHEPQGEVVAAPAITQSHRSLLRRVGPYAAIAIGVALVTGLAVWRLSRPVGTLLPVSRFAIEVVDQKMQLSRGPDVVAISPDGRQLVFAANQRLYRRALDQIDATPIAGTEAGGIGGINGSALSPFFSPDGQWIAFWQQRQLKKVPVGGGAPVTICALDEIPFGASWGDDGNIVWGAAAQGINRVSANGGTAESLISLRDGERGCCPQILPGGDWVLFVVLPDNAILSAGQVVAQSRATGERRVLVDGARDVRYVPSGHLVFGRGTTLFAQPFDSQRLRMSGAPTPVLDRVANSGNFPAMHVAVSSTGTLVYATAGNLTDGTSLVQVARDGTRSSLTDIAGAARLPRFSPEGLRVAYSASGDTNSLDSSDLWVVDVTRGARTPVTFKGNNGSYAIWTRDGTRLTFADGRGLLNRLLWTLADGSGGTETLQDVGTRKFPTSWSPDGKALAYYVGGLNSTRDLWILKVDGDQRTPSAFVETQYDERGAIFSPDGHWIAYVSNKSGQDEIYARPYPGPGGEVTISVGGGQEPVWAPSGRELFYRHEGTLLAAPIQQAASSLIVRPPTRVFDDPYMRDTAAGGGAANYDVSPDGQRFVMVQQLRPANETTQPVRLQVILNWTEELKARVPTGK